MKKLFFAALLAGFAFNTASAQDEEGTKGFAKGDVFMSGSVGFGNSSSGDVSADVFTIAPKVGYFVSENIAVGLKTGFTTWSADNDGVDTRDANEFAVGAFGRYYFSPTNQFSLFTELGVDYVSGEDKLADAKYDGFDIAFAPGISYFVSKNFAIEASLGILSYETEKYDGADDSQDDFNVGINFSDINFGVIYKF